MVKKAVKKVVKKAVKVDESAAGKAKTSKYKREATLAKNPSGRRYVNPNIVGNVAKAEAKGWVRIKNTDKKMAGLVLMELK